MHHPSASLRFKRRASGIAGVLSAAIGLALIILALLDREAAPGVRYNHVEMGVLGLLLGAHWIVGSVERWAPARRIVAAILLLAMVANVIIVGVLTGWRDPVIVLALVAYGLVALFHPYGQRDARERRRRSGG